VAQRRDLTLALPLRRALTPAQLLALVRAAQQPPRDPALPAAQQHGPPQVN
jgi:hypothetical protein